MSKALPISLLNFPFQACSFYFLEPQLCPLPSPLGEFSTHTVTLYWGNTLTISLQIHPPTSVQSYRKELQFSEGTFWPSLYKFTHPLVFKPTERNYSLLKKYQKRINLTSATGGRMGSTQNSRANEAEARSLGLPGLASPVISAIWQSLPYSSSQGTDSQRTCLPCRPAAGEWSVFVYA